MSPLRDIFYFLYSANRLVVVRIERLPLKDFLPHSEGHLVLDVRSPGEYTHACIPGAINLPLFTDEERRVVGTAYKQQSREDAIKIGLDFFGPKMRGMVEEVEKRSQEFASSRKGGVYVYCWRGGMRSAAVAWLLDLYGFTVKVLAGGYKTFRQSVLDTFAFPYPFQVVGGYTGSGKTELLRELQKRGETVIDLERIASHKGSAFGNIQMPPQPTQEMFENLLAMELQKHQQASQIWIEDESQRIGLVNIPGALWETIRQSPIYFLDVPFEERLHHISGEYGNCDKERMISAIQRITKRLGGVETKNAIQFLQNDQTTECFRILLKYYDKHYLKGLHNRQNLPALLRHLPCSKAGASNVALFIKNPSMT
jgi:tRNA 2-selenouridine synthase